MAKKLQRHREKWTPDEIRKLRELVGENTPTRVIALKLRRTPNAIRSKASEVGIPLAPWNRPPRKPKK